MIWFHGNRWRRYILYFIIYDRLSVGKFRRVGTETSFFTQTAISANTSIT